MFFPLPPQILWVFPWILHPYIHDSCFLYWPVILGTAVTSGTLDAIRERMKSMQLAASAGNLDQETRPLMYVSDNVNQVVSGQIPHASENLLQSGVLPMDERALSGLQARMERLKSGTIEPLWKEDDSRAFACHPITPLFSKMAGMQCCASWVAASVLVSHCNLRCCGRVLGK